MTIDDHAHLNKSLGINGQCGCPLPRSRPISVDLYQAVQIPFYQDRNYSVLSY